MCYRADRDYIHARRGNGGKSGFCHIARRLEQGFSVRYSDRLFHFLTAHIVEHYYIRARFESLRKLVKAADFYFYLHCMSELFTQRRDRSANAAVSVKVRILEHSAVGEIVAVVFSSADRDGVLLEYAQPGERFARIGDNGFRALGKLYASVRHRCNTRHML